ncbi:hypothetical protein ACR72Z_02915 [Lactobacillus iners]|uniref:hypothetical protein n=1 Tax=Lactobacillus iners TaxID=147802 RepID=UPI003EBC800A
MAEMLQITDEEAGAKIKEQWKNSVTCSTRNYLKNRRKTSRRTKKKIKQKFLKYYKSKITNRHT